MRRYMEARYIPYIRTRQRRAIGRSIPVRGRMQNAAIFIRYILCLVCLILTLCNIVNKYNNAVLTVTENSIITLINDYIDSCVINAKNSFSDNDFIEILNNRDSRTFSIKNDVVDANNMALVLSESILSELKNMDRKIIKKNSGGIIENGILASIVVNAPIRVVPIGKIDVTPEFTIEESVKNQKVHRLKMNISVKIKIIFPFHREEKHINRVITVSETIIP